MISTGYPNAPDAAAPGPRCNTGRVGLKSTPTRVTIVLVAFTIGMSVSIVSISTSACLAMNDLRELEAQAARQAFNPDHTAVHQDDPFLDYLRIEFCPCCGTPAAEAEPRFASSPPAETLCAEQHTSFLSGYTRARVFFTYFECPSCSAMFCPTYYRQSQLDGLYGRQAENMFYLPLESRKRTQEDYIDLLRRHSRMAGNFLEIGPDIGLFASSFGRLGAFDQFWLYEPNRDVHEPLAGNFRGMRHTIRTSIFRAADALAQSVSTAVMIHVLDHLLEPAQFLREIASSMEPDGVVFIVTHDCASLLARVLQGRWPPYTLQHPQLFSKRSIATLLQACGFEVVEIVKTTNYFPLPYLIRAALTVCGLPASFIPAGAAPLVAIKLGNIATVARKPR